MELPLEHRPPLQRKPTVLYRLKDVTGALLYVGITCDWLARRRAHAAEKSWWGDVAHVDLEAFPNRPAALEAEYAAVAAERPRWNIVGDTGRPQGRLRV